MSNPSAAAPVCYRHTDRETWIRCQRCDRPICPDCMNPASVGFQCPSCVKEGSKSTRIGRLPYGGEASADPRLSTFAIIAVNVAVWLAITANGGQSSSLVDKLSIIPHEGVRVLNGSLVQVPGVSTGSWWQVITSAFTHVEPLHIGLNMLALYFLGPALEQVLGRARFLAIYFVSAICGSAGVMLFADPAGATLGASGAIFGLMGALVVLALKVNGDVRSILMWIGLNLVITFTVPNISWQGHVGGLLGGALVAGALVYAPKEGRTWVQWGSVVAVSAIAVALIVVKAHALGASVYTS